MPIQARCLREQGNLDIGIWSPTYLGESDIRYIRYIQDQPVIWDMSYYIPLYG